MMKKIKNLWVIEKMPISNLSIDYMKFNVAIIYQLKAVITSKDVPICTAGTFNKLIKKLSGIHPDVELLYALC